jgi:hypothetical protein
MFRKLTLLVVTLVLPAGAFAQIVFPPPASVPVPVPTAPASGGIVKGEAPSLTTFNLQWVEYGVFSTPTQPLPSHFVVCLKLASAPNCTFAPGDFKAVAGIPNSKYYNGWQHVGYQYTYTLRAGSVPDSLLDADSTWSVGACRNATAASCVFSAPRALRISAVDLSVHQVRNNSTLAQAKFLARLMNNGTNTIYSTPPFKTSIIAWDAVKDPATHRCLTNVNDPSVRDDPDVIVFMDDGSTAWMTTLPTPGNVRTAPSLVVGMHKWTGGTTVRGNEESIQFDVPPMRVVDAATAAFDLPAAQRPKPFVVRVLADSRGLVKEFNEDNNFGAACEYVP